MTPEQKRSRARILRAATRFAIATENLGFLGAAHPDDWDGIKRAYRDARASLEKIIEQELEGQAHWVKELCAAECDALAEELKDDPDFAGQSNGAYVCACNIRALEG